jgi:hypothetical protein
VIAPAFDERTVIVPAIRSRVGVAFTHFEVLVV